jgi:hypothetical protein
MDSTGCNTNGHVTMAMAQSQVAPLSMACSCCLRTADERPGDDVRVWVRRALLHGRAVAGPARCAAVVRAQRGVFAVADHVAAPCVAQHVADLRARSQEPWQHCLMLHAAPGSGGIARACSHNVCTARYDNMWEPSSAYVAK